MKPIDAALSAFYPVIVVMGLLIWARFLPLLRTVEQNTRPLICSVLVLVTGIMVEQIVYGYGRFMNQYITIAMNPYMVALGKSLFLTGEAYMLYAFWLLSTVRPRLWVSLFFAASLWALIFAALLL